MVRVLHTGDLHALPPPLAGYDRTEEWRRCAAALGSIARDRKVDLIVVAGDLFDRNRPTPEEIANVAAVLSDLTEAGPVFVVPGTPSHDGDGPDRMGPTHLLAELDLQYVTVATEPEVFLPVNCAVACLPGVSKSWLANTDEAKGLSPVALNQLMAAKLAEVIRGLAAQAATSPGPRILVGHLSVDGCVASSDESIRMAAEPTLARDAFPDVFSAVCLGHIHKSQVIQERGPWIGYCGPLVRANWGEEADHRGCRVLDLDDATGELRSAEFVDLPATRLWTFELSVRDEADPQAAVLRQLLAYDVAGKVVRVKAQVRDEYAKLLDSRAVETLLLDRGAAHFAGLIPDVERTTRSRVQGAHAGLGPIEALELYLDNAQNAKGDRQALIERARGLLTEVGAG
jgi:exonuclease SbcD